jgi:hypothetical protein
LSSVSSFVIYSTAGKLKGLFGCFSCMREFVLIPHLDARINLYFLNEWQTYKN